MGVRSAVETSVESISGADGALTALALKIAESIDVRETCSAALAKELRDTLLALYARAEKDAARASVDDFVNDLLDEVSR